MTCAMNINKLYRKQQKKIKKLKLNMELEIDGNAKFYKYYINFTDSQWSLDVVFVSIVCWIVNCVLHNFFVYKWWCVCCLDLNAYENFVFEIFSPKDTSHTNVDFEMTDDTLFSR
jgi:hypothetical protein